MNHFIPISMDTIHKTEDNNHPQGLEKLAHLHYWCNCDMMQILQEKNDNSSEKNKNKILFLSLDITQKYWKRKIKEIYVHPWA